LLLVTKVLLPALHHLVFRLIVHLVII